MDRIDLPHDQVATTRRQVRATHFANLGKKKG